MKAKCLSFSLDRLKKLTACDIRAPKCRHEGNLQQYIFFVNDPLWAYELHIINYTAKIAFFANTLVHASSMWTKQGLPAKSFLTVTRPNRHSQLPLNTFCRVTTMPGNQKSKV